MMRDPAEGVLQRIGGQDPRRCVDQRIERAPACLRLCGHLFGIDPATRPLDRRAADTEPYRRRSSARSVWYDARGLPEAEKNAESQRFFVWWRHW